MAFKKIVEDFKRVLLEGVFPKQSFTLCSDIGNNMVNVHNNYPISIENFLYIINKCGEPTSNTRNNPRIQHRPGQISRMFSQRNNNGNGGNADIWYQEYRGVNGRLVIHIRFYSFVHQ